MSAAVLPASGYRPSMDLSPAWLIVALVVALFIVGGLVFAFIADRNRNEDVAHDTERLDPDPTSPPTDPSRRHGG